MVKGVHEENSNSPNGNLTIQSIIFVKNNRCRIEFLEGETITLNRTVSAEDSIYEGQVLSSSQIEDMIERSALQEAERVSIKLISNYLHSRAALKLKLIKRGFTQPVIEQVIARLSEAGFLDDAVFARAWIQIRLEKHPEGSMALFAGLKQRGIDSGIAQQAVEELFTPEQEQRCIRNVIIRAQVRQEVDPQQLEKLLQTRGFSRTAVRTAMEQWESE